MIDLSGRSAALMLTAVFVTAVVLFSGCDRSPNPDVIAAGGVVTVDGSPLNNAEVRFIPMQEGLDGNFIARGVSDDEGKFVLVFPGQTESKVCLGENKVIVLEGPVPDNAREQSEESQKAALKYSRTLKNRPIPKRYSSLSESPLSVNVSKDNTEYKIELDR